MNSQTIVKRHIRQDGVLDVFEIFGPTFQGEGPFAGTPCVFVRLAECNLQCPGCDTIYSDSHPTGGHAKLGWRDPLAIVHAVDNIAPGVPGVGKLSRPLVVVSGGEPFRQNIVPLLNLLTGAGYFVQIETNGTLPILEGGIGYNTNIAERAGVYIVVSPKTPKVQPAYNLLACAFKYVGAHDDLDPTDGLPVHVLHHSGSGKVARPGPSYRGLVYLQPMDHAEILKGELYIKEANFLSQQAVLRSCYNHGYIFGLQLHKVVGAR